MVVGTIDVGTTDVGTTGTCGETSGPPVAVMPAAGAGAGAGAGPGFAGAGSATPVPTGVSSPTTAICSESLPRRSDRSSAVSDRPVHGAQPAATTHQIIRIDVATRVDRVRPHPRPDRPERRDGGPVGRAHDTSVTSSTTGAASFPSRGARSRARRIQCHSLARPGRSVRRQVGQAAANAARRARVPVDASSTTRPCAAR